MYCAFCTAPLMIKKRPSDKYQVVCPQCQIAGDVGAIPLVAKTLWVRRYPEIKNHCFNSKAFLRVLSRNYSVYCPACGHLGPTRMVPKEAIVAWNSDVEAANKAVGT